MEKPRFVLKLKVLNAIDLPIMDVLWKSSDPYVIIYLGQKGRDFLDASTIFTSVFSSKKDVEVITSDLFIWKRVLQSMADEMSVHKIIRDEYLSQSWRTRVIPQELNPIWNEEFSLGITDPTEPIRFQVYDKDRIFRDDLIGVAELDIGIFAQAVQLLHHNCIMNGDSSTKWSGGSVSQDVALVLDNAISGRLFLQLRWDND